MKNNKRDPRFIGMSPSDKDSRFSNFFFNLNKEEQIKYMKDLECTSFKKTLVRTLLYGFIINFVIIALLGECKYHTDSGASMNTYQFLLIVSLILGWIISILQKKFENKK